MHRPSETKIIGNGGLAKLQWCLLSSTCSFSLVSRATQDSSSLFILDCVLPCFLWLCSGLDEGKLVIWFRDRIIFICDLPPGLFHYSKGSVQFVLGNSTSTGTADETRAWVSVISWLVAQTIIQQTWFALSLWHLLSFARASLCKFAWQGR